MVTFSAAARQPFPKVSVSLHQEQRAHEREVRRAQLARGSSGPPWAASWNWLRLVSFEKNLSNDYSLCLLCISTLAL